jgi:oligopeptide/dipeptide ABC transporter ATP-binding protein
MNQIATTILSDTTLLKVRNLHCTFESNRRTSLFGQHSLVHAVNGVSFDITPGEAFALVGESGCGKSTIAKSILNIVSPSEGSVEFYDQELVGLSDSNWKPLRQKIQYVFQDPLGALDPRMTILDQVIEPLIIHHLHGPDERLQLAKDLLQSVGLQSSQLNKFPHELSGGQRQRVVLARALILKPELLICDEPISALDVSIQAQIVNLLQQLRSDMGLTLLFISHDLSIVSHLCDRVAVMYLGQIVEMGATQNIFGNPQHPYTQALISAIPKAEQSTKSKRINLIGEPPSPEKPPTGCHFHPRCRRATQRCSEENPTLQSNLEGHAVACFEAKTHIQEIFK